MRLNTTREERAHAANATTEIIVCRRGLLSDVAKDCNAIEDELARVRADLTSVREELSRCDRLFKESEALCLEAFAERDKLRAELEAARLVVDACLSQNKDRWDIEEMAIKHQERFGGRDGAVHSRRGNERKNAP